MKRLKIVKSFIIFWLFIYFLVYSNWDEVVLFFVSSLAFNIAILTLLVVGIIVTMQATINIVMLAGTFGAMAYKKDNLEFYLQGIDKILPANIAYMFHTRAEQGVLLFTAEESRAVIEWLEDKFSYQNRYINYFIGTVLMIGLLGTFSGLLVSIDEMGRIILSLTGDIDLGEIIRSFSGPLGGMAVGFGSSLFGVVAAIIMGVMGYILSKNQEILIEGVEDWLKGRIIETPVGAPAGTVVDVEPTTAELPAQRSSFMDVFVETIGSMTKEMANIVNSNGRLHSIVVASMQAERDEHEQNYMLFESMEATLKEIASRSQEEMLSLKEELAQHGKTLAEILKSQQEHNGILRQKSEDIVAALDALKSQNTQELTQLRMLFKALDEKLSIQSEILGKIATLSEESTKERRQLLSHLVAVERQLDTALESIEKEIKNFAFDTKEGEKEFVKLLQEFFANIHDSQKEAMEVLLGLDSSLNANLRSIYETTGALKQVSTQEKESLEKLLQEEIAIQKEAKEHMQQQYEILQELAEYSKKSSLTLGMSADRAEVSKKSGFFTKLFK